MRIYGKEFAKAAKAPVLWFVLLVFLLLDWFCIAGYLSETGPDGELDELHDVILDMGLHRQNWDVKDSPDGGLRQFYTGYMSDVWNLYDGLDMNEIKRAKESMCRYKPSGAYAAFLDRNYEKLQERVEEIRTSGSGRCGGYPGLVYKVHGKLYSRLTKNMLLQAAVLMALCVLYLMDYERVCRTQDLVWASKSGRRTALKKTAAGISAGLVFSALLFAGSYAVFFTNVPMRGLWRVPVSAVSVAEIRNQMFYPFVTFWDLDTRTYFAATLAVILLLLVVTGGFTAAVQLFVQNGYFTFLLEALLSMGIFLVLYCVQSATFFDVAKALNPVALWVTVGGWFMENELSLSFAGNEFWCVGVSAAVTLAMLAAGWRRYNSRS